MANIFICYSALAREAVIYLEKNKPIASKGQIKPGSIEEKNLQLLSNLKWREQYPCIIGLKPSIEMVYAQQIVNPVGFIRFDSIEHLYNKLLPEMRGTLRWMDGDAFLMASNTQILNKFLRSSGKIGFADKFHQVIPGSGMTYVVSAKHLNASQKKVCFNSSDDAETILYKSKFRKTFRTQSAYSMWELLAFPLDTPLRFYRCQSSKDVALLLHDTLLSMKSMEDDVVAQDFLRTTANIKQQEVILAINCFYQALNQSDQQIRAMLYAVATRIAKLPKNATEQQIRQAMVELFCNRIMASNNMQLAVMNLASEIANTLEGKLINELSDAMRMQVTTSFNKAMQGKTKQEIESFRESSINLFTAMHKAFLGYFTDSTGLTRWFAYHFGSYIDNRALILDKLFSSAIEGLE